MRAALASKTKKTKVDISTTGEPLEEINDPGGERPVLVSEAVIPVSLQLVEILLDDDLEIVGGGAWVVGSVAERE